MSHFLERCSCGIVLNQCRCAGNKKETISTLPCPHRPAMREPTGTVQRWDAYVQTEGAGLHVDWAEDETGEYVTYDDHKAAMDLLAAQAVALATAIIPLLDDYVLVLRFGLERIVDEEWVVSATRNLATAEDSKAKAQALLDAQGAKK